MRIIAIVLIVAGLALLAYAFQMNVSVPDPSGEFGALANNDLMNQRLLFAVAGVGAFLGGWLALAVDAIRKIER